MVKCFDTHLSNLQANILHKMNYICVLKFCVVRALNKECDLIPPICTLSRQMWLILCKILAWRWPNCGPKHVPLYPYNMNQQYALFTFNLFQ